jgi:hypothetical protein
MSRSGYHDDYDEDGKGGLWRGAVARSINGKRGQSLLRELRDALDAMPVKTLAAESLVTADGEFCTLGALGQARGLDMARIDPEDWDAVAKAFGVAPALVREVVYENDEGLDHSVYRDGRWVNDEATPENRWKHMRAWTERQITPTGRAA